MRLLACLLLVSLLATAPARAENVADAYLKPLRYDPEVLERARKRAVYRRNIGIGLAIPGVAQIILGCVLVVSGGRTSNFVGGGAQIASGAVIGGLGVTFAIPGIVLWVMGQDDLDVVSWRKHQQERAALVELRF